MPIGPSTRSSKNRSRDMPDHTLDEAPDDVGRDRVVPRRPRIEEERHRGEVRDGRRRGRCPAARPTRSRGAGRRVDGMAPLEAVGEPGGVGEEVPDADGLGRGTGDRRLGRTLDVDAGFGELREPPCHLVVQVEPPLLVEHHRGDRGHRLGHRVDPPDRVGSTGSAALDVAAPTAAHPRDLAVAPEHAEPAREPPAPHVLVEVGRDPREPGGVESAGGRVDDWTELGHRHLPAAEPTRSCRRRPTVAVRRRHDRADDSCAHRPVATCSERSASSRSRLCATVRLARRAPRAERAESGGTGSASSPRAPPPPPWRRPRDDDAVDVVREEVLDAAARRRDDGGAARHRLERRAAPNPPPCS